MKLSLRCIAIGLIFSSMASWAMPANLHWSKEQLLDYQRSGAYATDIARVVSQAKVYLAQRVAHRSGKKKMAVMIDVDETALSNFAAIKMLFSLIGNVGDTLSTTQLQAITQPFHDPAIAPVLSLYRLAQAHHVAVFFITGRTSNDRAGTIKNLKTAGYSTWQQLILRQPNQVHLSALQYKRAAARSVKQQGYDLVLAIGDQYSDLPAPYADAVYKLPNPFYYIP